MINLYVIIAAVVIWILAMFVYPQWRIKRAIPQVIRIFKERNAIGIKNAKTVDELGLRPKSLVEQMLRRRDYKQYALNGLMQAQIVQKTEDGRLFLSEEKLAESVLGRTTPYSIR